MGIPKSVVMAVPTPAPAPTDSPFEVTGTTCSDRFGTVAVPSTYSSPVGLTTTPMPTTSPAYMSVGQDCAATAYAGEPVTPQVAASPGGSVTVDGFSGDGLTVVQVVTVGICIVVFLAAARFWAAMR